MKTNQNIFDFVSNIKEIRQVDQAIKKYWQENPPTLGHGYSHILKVARNAFTLSKLNRFSEPDLAFVTGMLHDVYRPAFGQAGLEEHSKMNVEQAERILEKSQFSKKKNQITKAILGHSKGGKKPGLDYILSLADKMDMSFQRALSYAWASNLWAKKKGEIIYTSFLETMRDFCIFQVKAWEFFLATNYLGKSKSKKEAIFAYIETHQDLITAVKDELKGVDYFTIEKKFAEKEAKQDLDFLRGTKTPKNVIKKVTASYGDLLGVTLID